MSITNQKEYLKKYLSGPDPEKKKKKKHKSRSAALKGLMIVDSDAGSLSNIPFGSYDEDDAPTVAEITYDRVETKIKDHFQETKNKWKTLNITELHDKLENMHYNGNFEGMTEEKRGEYDPMCYKKRNESSKCNKKQYLESFPPGRKHNFDTSSKRSDSAEIFPSRNKSNLDTSLPRTENSDTQTHQRRRRHDSDSSPLGKRHDSDSSPRKRHDSDASPPRKRQDSDTSPHRRRDFNVSPARRKHDSDDFPLRRRHDSDSSPPRRRHDSDASPLRRRHDSDASPLRRRHDSNASPIRRRHDSDASPPRKRQDSDTSPHRKRVFNASPARRRHDSDSSPERRRHDSDSSPPRRKPDVRKRCDSGELSLQKQLKVQSPDSDESPPRNVQSDRSFSDSIRRPEKNMTTQEFLIARKKGKLKKESAEDIARKEREAELQKAAEKQHLHWNKGLAQLKQRQQRAEEVAHEMTKCFARTSDDQDRDNFLRTKVLAEDPMMDYIKKKKERGDGAPKFPQYQGSFPANRFNIKPGYRWDGVDRSNGFEKDYFDKQSSQVAVEDDAYRYCAEAM